MKGAMKMPVERGLKIATIGGGSSYTPEIIEGFIKRYAELPVKDLYLVDIKAGIHGDYNAAFQALTIHPLVESSIVKDLLADIISENIDYLPQFKVNN